MENTNTCQHANLRNVASWRFCEPCNKHMAMPADCCRSCGGKGIRQRMASAYERKGKTYRCGACKGTGSMKPIPCVCCDAPSVMEVSRVMGIDGIWRGEMNQPLRALCQSCYDAEAK
jgi:DnaJ-class molecular chaperone